MNERNKEYLELLKHSFDENFFISFVKDLLNLSSSDIANNFNEKTDVSKQFEENIKYYKYIAKYNDGLNNNIGIFIIKLSDKTTSNARNIQRNFVAKLLSTFDLDASLVSFYSDKETSWRISFVKKELSFGDKGFKEVLTPAKRYSYLVGEHESVHTAKQYLLKLLEIDSRKITLSDIESVFDVEKVTKKFFEEYKEKYLQLKEYLDKNKDFITESEKFDFNSVEFAKKLMGQIVFLYFLQKKGWLGVELIPNQLSHSEYNKLLSQNDSVSQNLIKLFYELKDSEYFINKNKLKQAEKQDVNNFTNIFIDTEYNKPWGSGEKGFIRSIYKQAIKENMNFFEEYLEPFFYKGLNEKRENQYFPLFNCKVPFLNGGLFEPLNNYRWSSTHFNIPNNMFSNENKDGILDFLDLYNFTIDEEEPLEKEVAVDPEMLGKIFENLLEVDDRKSKGAFYTPREIVYYMCQESLANYLVTKVGVDYDETIKFIKYGDLISQIDWECSNNGNGNFEIGSTIYKNIVAIDKALIDVKVADPAVGSGAFPLGILTEIVKLRNNLTIYLMIQNELGIINISELSSTEQNKRDIFDMKLQTIENCIYAVDIEISAVDIAKLRLWLSLIVDYPNNEEPKPLPNLDCKIMQGNSLVDEFENVPLFDEKILNRTLNKKNNIIQQNLFKNDSDIYIQQTLRLYDDCIDYNKYIDEMIKLQKTYFAASVENEKKELKSKIEKMQLDMVEESLKNNTLKLQKFEKTYQKKSKPWFIWKLEFYDVFKCNGGFDIVIGNPPYLEARSDKFSDELKDQLQEIMSKRYGKKQDYISRGSDLLIYFYELATNLINETGTNMFITQNSWLDTDFGQKFQQYLLKEIKPCFILDSDFKSFKDNANINTIITLIKSKSYNREHIDFIRLHIPFSEISFSLNCLDVNKDYSSLSIKRFSLKSKIIKDFKWGFLYNSPNFFIDLIEKLKKNGLTADKISSTSVSIGQGLNLKKCFIYNKSELPMSIYNSLIPIYTVENNGVIRWDCPTNYIIDSIKISNDVRKELNKDLYLFDSTKTSKVPPVIIMPRGISNRYYSTFNECNGFSASYVDIYIDNYEKHIDLAKRIWLFTNSTIFKLYREITGRNNLGGGMLKAEATDLKNVPIYFEFDMNSVNEAFEMSKDIIADSTENDIDSEFQTYIDKIVYDYLKINVELQKAIAKELLFLISSRYNKSVS